MIPEEGDPKWDFVRNVLRIFEKRKMRKIVSKHGVKPFKPKRSLIEDVFKVIKGAFSLDKIHRFTLSSVTKILLVSF